MGPQNGGYSPFSKEGVLSSYKNSLKNLDGFQINAFLLHDPSKDELDEFFAPGTGGVETFKELRDLAKSGPLNWCSRARRVARFHEAPQ